MGKIYPWKLAAQLADTPLSRLRDEIERDPLSRRGGKQNRTLYLHKARFEQLRKYCDYRGIRPSEVVDRLIALYLEEVKSNPPTD